MLSRTFIVFFVIVYDANQSGEGRISNFDIKNFINEIVTNIISLDKFDFVIVVNQDNCRSSGAVNITLDKY